MVGGNRDIVDTRTVMCEWIGLFKRSRPIPHTLAAGGLYGDARKLVRRGMHACIAASLMGNIVVAQDREPTVEETIDYLNSKLALCPAGFAQEITLEEGNSVRVTGHSVGRPGQYRTRIDEVERRHEVRFGLADIRINLQVETLEEGGHQIGDEPVEVTVISTMCAQVGCIDVIKGTMQDRSGTDIDGFLSERFLYDRDTATEYHFFACDDDAAQRFENALMHVLEVGGAQEELF